MSAMTSEVCQDCDPKHTHTQAQPARKSDMSTIPSPSSLPGPSIKAEAGAETQPLASQSTQPTTGEESIEPPASVYPSIIIEFCDRCRWAPRATWIQTELFLTFPTPAIKSITLIPLSTPETGGRFRVWLNRGQGQGQELVWDRKTEGGFPELKVLKQRLRNLIQPEMSLGHSDKPASEAK